MKTFRVDKTVDIGRLSDELASASIPGFIPDGNGRAEGTVRGVVEGDGIPVIYRFGVVVTEDTAVDGDVQTVIDNHTKGGTVSNTVPSEEKESRFQQLEQGQ